MKRKDPTLPLWLLFLAVQLLDVAWAPFILLGIEKARIVPGITRSNPLDLFYMPYTHSLIAAILWSIGAAVLFKLFVRYARIGSAIFVGLAVLSHWILDFVVHRPDLPLYDNAAKVGLGLWNLPVAALSLEALLLFGGILLCIRAGFVRPIAVMIFGAVMLSIQVFVFFGPPPESANAAAVTALVAYVVFAVVIHRMERSTKTNGQAT